MNSTTNTAPLVSCDSGDLRKAADFFRVVSAVPLRGVFCFSFTLPITLTFGAMALYDGGLMDSPGHPNADAMRFVSVAPLFGLWFYAMLAISDELLHLMAGIEIHPLIPQGDCPFWAHRVSSLTRLSNWAGKFAPFCWIGCGLPFAVPLQIAWHVRLGQCCGLLGSLVQDAKLLRLGAESRRVGWALLFDTLGLPVVIVVLNRSGLAGRFTPIILALLTAFICYALILLRRMCRSAAVVMDALADARIASGSSS